MKRLNRVAVLLTAIGGLSQQLAAQTAQIVTSSSVLKSNFFAPGQGAGSPNYIPLGLPVTNIFTINMKPFSGQFLSKLKVSFLLSDPAAPVGISGQIDFGHYANPTYDANSSYGTYIMGNTFIPDGKFDFLTELAMGGSGVTITFSQFQLAGNQSLITGSNLNVAFDANNSALIELAGVDGLVAFTTAPFAPLVTGEGEIVTVPEPATWITMVLGLLVTAFARKRQRWSRA